MTGSWTLDIFIISSIILLLIPVLLCVYKEIIQNKAGDSNDV